MNEKKIIQNNRHQKTHHERRRSRDVEELKAELEKKEKKIQKLSKKYSDL